jgi:ribose transport system ATP-binding protein
MTDSQLSLAGGVSANALELRGISKRFGPTRALKDVSFHVSAGAVHALVGGNGSGKSTMIKILAGVQNADLGSITIHGIVHDASSTSATWARDVGLRFVHQDLGLFPSLSVLENVSLGQGYDRRFGRLIAWKRAEARVASLLQDFEIGARPRDTMSMLRPADRTMVAIARALGSSEPPAGVTLVLDEPTSALPEAEVERLLTWLKRSAVRGTTTIFVTHRLEEILDVASEITVLRDGQHIETGPAAAWTRARLVEQIIGAEGANDEAEEPRTATSPAGTRWRLGVEDLWAGPLRSVSFDVKAGEIVGIAGLLGSGRTRLMRCLGGVDRVSRGTITLDGQSFQPWPQRRSIRAGIAFVPESRAEEGIFPGLSVAENLQAAGLATRSGLSSYSPRRMQREAKSNAIKYTVKTAGVGSDILTLSGGNQQKVLLGRWLATNPQVLLLDEPSVGVDVGARASLHALIRRRAAAGTAVVCVSSDFEELAELSERVLVLRDGKIGESLAGNQLNAQTIGHAVHGRVEG